MPFPNPAESRTFTLISGNEGKIAEFEHAVKNLSLMPNDLRVDMSTVKYDTPELQGTLEEIAIDKVKGAANGQIASQPGSTIVVEDTSLAFIALGGMPGPYIK